MASELREHERVGTKRRQRRERLQRAYQKHMASTVKIDKDIPPPPEKKRVYKYPFAQMEVGDSFRWNVEERRKVATAAQDHTRRTGWRFTVRKQFEDGIEVIRVWRVE